MKTLSENVDFLRVVFMILVLFKTLPVSNGDNDLAKVKTFAQGLHGIITEFYLKKAMEFDIIAVDIRSWKFSADVIQYLPKHSINLKTITIRFIDASKFENMNLTKSSIIFMRDSGFLTTVNDIKMQLNRTDDAEIRHFIALESTQLGAFRMSGQSNSIIFITNFILYLEKPRALQLHQMITSCGVNKVVIPLLKAINWFILRNNCWRTGVFELTEPMENLNGCNYITECQECFGIIEFKIKFALKMLEILSRKLNFELSLVKNLSNISNQHVFIFNVKTLSRAVVYNSFVYETSEYTLVFSTGEPYSPFEKLILPFDWETWTAFGVTFTIGFLTIFLLKRFDLAYQKFIFGSNVRSPAFNMMVIVFFGQGQSILPGRNFARYLLMLFILFCLIIRTGYQGVQFEMIYQVSSNQKIYSKWIFISIFIFSHRMLENKVQKPSMI